MYPPVFSSVSANQTSINANKLPLSFVFLLFYGQ